jgi:hypothetical protein
MKIYFLLILTVIFSINIFCKAPQKKTHLQTSDKIKQKFSIDSKKTKTKYNDDESEIEDYFDEENDIPEEKYKIELPEYAGLVNYHLTLRKFASRINDYKTANQKSYTKIRIANPKAKSKFKIKGFSSGLFRLPYPDIMNNIPSAGIKISKKRLKFVGYIKHKLNLKNIRDGEYYSLGYFKKKGGFYYFLPLLIRTGSVKLKIINIYRFKNGYFLEAAGRNKYYIYNLSQEVKLIY